MVSTLEKRLMMTKLAAKHASPKSCRLCHGPLISPKPSSPPTRAIASGTEVDCHPNCLPFACPGCVEKGRLNYGLVDYGNIEQGCHCSLCVEEEQDGEGWEGRVIVTVST